MTALRIVTVVGNPKARGRTSAVAAAVADAIGFHLRRGHDGDGDLVATTIEVADLGAGLLAWGSDEVASAIGDVCRADLVVIASPTFKATYTGLLKLFLDQVPSAGLAGVVAVPVMVGGAPHHALAVEVHLRPLLVELGASVPGAGLYVLESDLPALDVVVKDWWARSGTAIANAVSAISPGTAV